MQARRWRSLSCVRLWISDHGVALQRSSAVTESMPGVHCDTDRSFMPNESRQKRDLFFPTTSSINNRIKCTPVHLIRHCCAHRAHRCAVRDCHSWLRKTRPKFQRSRADHACCYAPLSAMATLHSPIRSSDTAGTAIPPLPLAVLTRCCSVCSASFAGRPVSSPQRHKVSAHSTQR